MFTKDIATPIPFHTLPYPSAHNPLQTNALMVDACFQTQQASTTKRLPVNTLGADVIYHRNKEARLKVMKAATQASTMV
jgi:hypothetical protein